MSLQIRPSQFITTYGPGAILEGPDGPRMIPALSQLFGENSKFAGKVANFEVPEPRLAALLGPTAGIVRIPTNAELGWPETKEVYWTRQFPTWSLCPRHSVLYRYRGRPNQQCPQCPRYANEDAWDRSTREAIRFVRACPKGHLDEVHWSGIVRHNRSGCSPDQLLWRGGGSALRHVSIVCPQCRGEINLGVAYSRDWPCSGRRPERMVPLQDPNARPGCDAKARMIQKGAANLRMPVLQAALTIPRLDTRLHLFLSQLPIRSVLAVAPPKNKNSLLDMLARLVQQKLIPESGRALVSGSPWSTVSATIADVTSPTLPTNYRELLEQEFRELRNAAENGAPAHTSASPGGPPCFEVVRTAVRTGVAGPKGVRFRVAPVSRLRVVLVQRGFQRLDPSGDEISNGYNDGASNRKWFPGVELFGEGIFVQLDPEQRADGLKLEGAAAEAWREAWQKGDPNVEMNETHPVHVWWHTLAHRLINVLSVDSGYSSAAIRERVYLDFDSGSGEARGGVILYTTQPGGDGTLGGLINLVPDFEHILHSALRDDVMCSNDPLCMEEEFGAGRVNGAACYACQLISETSCEHRNRWLDRRVLIDNMP